MIDFLAGIAASFLDPLVLAGGVGIGFLFHKDWARLAWMLLLFVMPGAGSLEAGAHGFVFVAAVQFIATCLIVTAVYAFLERPRRIAS